MPSPLLPVLALDTATETIAAGVCVDARAGAAAFTQMAAGGALASTQLLPLLRGLLNRAGIEWLDIGAIAYGQGPGAFTGLRTACAVAQGLGFGIGCRLLPIDSLLIVAEDARLQAGLQAGLQADLQEHTPDRLQELSPDPCEVAVAMDARMDEAYCARYRWQGGHWHVVQAPALVTLPALNTAWSALPPQGLVAGSALAAFGDRLLLPAGCQRVLCEADRAAALLRLAQSAALDSEGVDPADALPLYLRDKVALTTAERAAVKAQNPPAAGPP